ncbi:MAG TPA: IS1595 family transposase [Gemmatimonadales bacterium]|nr:IS1595 family transposase [Gemmatimonadales bacterium]
MAKTPNLPATLHEAIRYFADPDVALTFLVCLRWPHGVFCPACNAKNPGFLKTRRIWKCRDCGRQFSVKLGTIFEDSPIGLDRWLPALWMLANSKNGISSYELGRALGVTQKTAWFMLHRIRLAMQSRTFRKMRGDVEADESFLGGAAKFMHHDKKKRVVRGTGGMDKVAVFGLLQRGKGKKASRVVASVVSRIRKKDLQKQVREKVKAGSALFTDAFWSYKGLDADYKHQVVDHAREYVRGQVHTNGLENFWSLLKRTIKGTYISVDPFHVAAYLDEQVHRFNNRGLNDRGRFVDVVKSIVDKRLSYRDLIGADLSPATT